MIAFAAAVWGSRSESRLLGDTGSQSCSFLHFCYLGLEAEALRKGGSLGTGRGLGPHSSSLPHPVHSPSQKETGPCIGKEGGVQARC